MRASILKKVKFRLEIITIHKRPSVKLAEETLDFVLTPAKEPDPKPEVLGVRDGVLDGVLEGVREGVLDGVGVFERGVGV